MKSIIIANRSEQECERVRESLGDAYEVHAVTSPEKLDALVRNTNLILLDHNFTGDSGIDVLSRIMEKTRLPVLMLTSPDEPRCAVEAIRQGAYNYLVKTKNYHDLLHYAIKEAIEKYSEREEMKKTILRLRRQVRELREKLRAEAGREGTPDADPFAEERMDLVEEITARFRKGEVNLPAYPKINAQFRRLIDNGAPMSQFTDLLKQDTSISSKLLSISNSPYYCGVVQNKTLNQAISRLGLRTTKNYVEIIANRSLYTSQHKKHSKVLRRLWEHSLACAYAAESFSDLLGIGTPDEAFTMGLFHDIGKLLLIQVTIELEPGLWHEGEIASEELIRTLSIYHGTFGAALLKKWEFPPDYFHICMYHDDPAAARSRTEVLMVVYLANLLVRHMGFTLNEEEAIDLEALPRRLPSLTSAGLDLPLIERVKKRVFTLMENAAGSI